MSQQSAISLWDRHTRQLVSATLMDTLDTNEVLQASISWKPLIEARAHKLIADGIPRAQWPQHIHWDWEAKAAAVAGLLAYQIMGIEAEGAMQGRARSARRGKPGGDPLRRPHPGTIRSSWASRVLAWWEKSFWRERSS